MSSIKVFVTGAVHMVGRGDKGKGEPYDFANVLYSVKSSSFSNAYMRRRSVGNEETPVSISPDLIDSILDSLDTFPLPCDVELTLAPDPRDVKNNVVVAVKLPEKSNDPLKKFSPNATA